MKIGFFLGHTFASRKTSSRTKLVVGMKRGVCVCVCVYCYYDVYLDYDFIDFHKKINKTVSRRLAHVCERVCVRRG